MTMRWTVLLALFAACFAADGSWAVTGQPQYTSAPVTILTDSGFVLSMGSDQPGFYGSCSIFDPNLGTWTATASLPSLPNYPPRFTPVRLINGKILAIESWAGLGKVNTCEIYDPNLSTWTITGSLPRALELPKFIVLNSGKVLCISGRNRDSSGYIEIPPKTYYLYDPDSGLWAEGGTIPDADLIAFFERLPSGKVLAIGGRSDDFSWSKPYRCQIYDPDSNTWSATGGMSELSSRFVTVVLSSGGILAIGGANAAQVTSTCELYDHVRGTWIQTGSLITPRYAHNAVVLASGKALVFGGVTSQGTLIESCELYDPITRQWNSTATYPSRSLYTKPSATLLKSGKVLAMSNDICAIYSGPLDSPGVHVTPYTAVPTPTWSWMSSGGGNGTFRWKLDDSDLTFGSAQGADLAFTPGTPLVNGSHTLYVQERNDAGDWSDSGSATVVVDLNVPSAALTISTESVGYGSTVTLTVTFSEPMVGFAANKLLASNATVGTAAASTDQQTFTVPVTIGPPGPVHILLPAYSVTDLGGHYLMTDAALDLTSVAGPRTSGNSEVVGGGAGGCGAGGAAGVLLGLLGLLGLHRHRPGW